MMKCLNCRLDIVQGGMATGIGHAAMLSLVNRFGRAKVVKEYLRLRDAQEPKKKTPRQPGIARRH